METRVGAQESYLEDGFYLVLGTTGMIEMAVFERLALGPVWTPRLFSRGETWEGDRVGQGQIRVPQSFACLSHDHTRPCPQSPTARPCG